MVRVFYITNDQDNAADLIDDIIHEFAHHVEMLYPEEIYGDEKLKKEFIKSHKTLMGYAAAFVLWRSRYDKLTQFA